jgi:hypothetical protein
MVSSTRRRVLAAATLFAALACGEAPTTPAGSDPFTPNERRERVALEVARAIAVAMADPDVRLAVRDAMQASTYAEHKLLLHEFMQTPTGDAVRASAAARGVDPAALGRALAQLPEMDFYVPFDEHRLEWTGGGDVLVTATMDVDEPKLVAFHTSGVGEPIDISQGGPAQALFMVHPGERKRRRVAGPEVAALQSIEGPGERLEPWIVEVPRADASTFMSLSSAAPTDTVRIQSFRIWFSMDAGGDSEPEFRASVYANTNGTFGSCCYKSWEHPNASPMVIYSGGIIGHRIPRESMGEYMDVSLYENDPFNADDYFGTVVVRREGAYEWRTSMYGNPNADAVIRFASSQDPPRVVRVSVMPASATRNVGQSVNYSFTAYDQYGRSMTDLGDRTVSWSSSAGSVATVSRTGTFTATARAVGAGSATILVSVDGLSKLDGATGSSALTVNATTPPPFSVSISGPSSLASYSNCMWFAEVSGGSGPFTYEWTVDGMPAGESSSYFSYWMGSEPVTLGVTVRESDGTPVTASKFVSVDPDAYCYQYHTR